MNIYYETFYKKQNESVLQSLCIEFFPKNSFFSEKIIYGQQCLTILELTPKSTLLSLTIL